MLTAITRKVSPSFASCQLEYLQREPIDVAPAEAQHRNYEAALERLGARVISLPAEPNLPDCVFVEDPALVLDEIAVITRMGAESRRAEAQSLAEALANFRPLKHIIEPGTLEGGDVVRIGRKLYVGVSRRTNPAGVRQLAGVLEAYGYSVTPVPVHGCLHLKTACCSLGDGAVLANRELFDWRALTAVRYLDVPADEPWSADVLAMGGAIVQSRQFPQTIALLQSRGYKVRAVDVSELHKAEAGVTCMSLVFEAD